MENRKSKNDWGKVFWLNFYFLLFCFLIALAIHTIALYPQQVTALVAVIWLCRTYKK